MTMGTVGDPAVFLREVRGDKSGYSVVEDDGCRPLFANLDHAIEVAKRKASEKPGAVFVILTSVAHVRCPVGDPVVKRLNDVAAE